MSKHEQRLSDPICNWCRCQDCGESWHDADLLPVGRLVERVAPGEPMPAGECPACGALCHVEGRHEARPIVAWTTDDAPHEGPLGERDVALSLEAGASDLYLWSERHAAEANAAGVRGRRLLRITLRIVSVEVES